MCKLNIVKHRLSPFMWGLIIMDEDVFMSGTKFCSEISTKL